MRIIKKAERGTTVSYEREFQDALSPGCGYGFPCDPTGNVDLSTLQPPAQDAWKQLTTTGKVGGRKYIDRGVNRREHNYRNPAIGECNACQREVTLDGFTNTCDCGIDYNMSGQALAPRSQWGEETGETAADILTGPFDLDSID